MLSSFEDHLTQKALVKEKYVPFYMKWVSDCYAFLNISDSMILNLEQKMQFLKNLAKTHEDWQVKQASNALRLYNYYLTSSVQKNTSAKSSGDENEWSRLETRTREALRFRHRSYSTEKTYITWLHSFQRYIHNKNPSQLVNGDIQDFLSYLAVERKVSASTQNQALNALIFIYRHVLEKEIGVKELDAVRAIYKRRLPVILTVKEVHAIFDHLSGVQRIMAKLTYGCGLRLLECLSLRIKDIDLEQNIVVVMAGKGDKDRRTMLPESLKDDLIQHISKVRSLYDQDREKDINGVYLPRCIG